MSQLSEEDMQKEGMSKAESFIPGAYMDSYRKSQELIKDPRGSIKSMVPDEYKEYADAGERMLEKAE